MQNFLSRAKTIGVYALIVIGALTLVVFLFQTITSGGLFSLGPSIQTPNQYAGTPMASETSFQNPLSGASRKVSDFFTGKSPQAKNTDAGSQISEGQLTQRKVVKNGSLSLLVQNAEDVAQSIQSIAERLGGFTQNAQIYEVSTGTKAGSVAVRVPADKFAGAMEEIKKLAVKVERENINAQDVTEQFVDFEAQLRNLKAAEEQYLSILKHAGTIQETLNVTQQLQNVRGDIERIEGQLKFLSRQVDMSTINVDLTAEADVEVFGIHWRPLFVIKQSFRSLLSGLTGYIDSMIDFLLRLPVYVLWLGTIIVFAIIAWKVIYWIWKKFFAQHGVV